MNSINLINKKTTDLAVSKVIINLKKRLTLFKKYIFIFTFIDFG